MVLFNYAIREITAKLVYYGPGLGGKTTNLQKIHENIEAKARGKLISLATDADRTLFFDFLPIDLGQIGGYRVRFQLYTVPGQVHYNATRKLVLKGVDAIVFVADSQIEMLERNRESFENLKENLAENGYDWTTIPIAYQFNKQDLPNTATPEEIAEAIGLEPDEVTWFPGVALEGKGVFETLKAIIKLTIAKLKAQFEDGQLGGVAKGKDKAKVSPRVKAMGQEIAPPPVPKAPPPAPEPEPEPEPVGEFEREPQPETEQEFEPVAEFEPEPQPETMAETEAEPTLEPEPAGVVSSAPAGDDLHEVDLDNVLAEEHAQKAFEMEVVNLSGSQDAEAEPEEAVSSDLAEAPSAPPEFAAEGEAATLEEEVGLAGESIPSPEGIPLAEPWEQAVDLEPSAAKGGFYGTPGGARPPEEEAEERLEITASASPDYYTMDRTEAEARALSPETETGAGLHTREIWPEPPQPPEPALVETAGRILPSAPAATRPEPAPAAAPAADAGEVAAMREHMAAIERSLAEITGALIEQRRLLNKVIDLAVGRMFNPGEEPSGGSISGPAPQRGFWSRLFGGGS